MGAAQERRVFVGSAINTALANLMAAELLCLHLEAPEQDVQLHIQQPWLRGRFRFAVYQSPDAADPT